jgi:hypothetical protein
MSMSRTSGPSVSRRAGVMSWQGQTFLAGHTRVARRSDVVGLRMGLEDEGKGEAQLAHQHQVSVSLLENGVDEGGLAHGLIADEVGVGRRLGVEKLVEIHGEGSLFLESLEAGKRIQEHRDPHSGRGHAAGRAVSCGSIRSLAATLIFWVGIYVAQMLQARRAGTLSLASTPSP